MLPHVPARTSSSAQDKHVITCQSLFAGPVQSWMLAQVHLTYPRAEGSCAVLCCLAKFIKTQSLRDYTGCTVHLFSAESIQPSYELHF